MKFYGIPLEYWTPSGLSYIASAVGRPLHTDSLTATKNRIRFARVCAEIDAATEFVEEFYLQGENGEWITIFSELEWVPVRCSTCCVFGHSMSACPKKCNQAGSLPDKDITEGEWTEVGQRRKGKEVFPVPLASGREGSSQLLDGMNSAKNQVPGEPPPPYPFGGECSIDLVQESAGPSGGCTENHPAALGSPLPSLPHDKDSLEPLTPSPDPNPIGRLAADSLERKGPSQFPNKGKNKSHSPPLGSGSVSPSQVWFPPSFLSAMFFACFHIRGLNDPLKQGEVRK